MNNITFVFRIHNVCIHGDKSQTERDRSLHGKVILAMVLQIKKINMPLGPASLMTVESDKK